MVVRRPLQPPHLLSYLLALLLGILIPLEQAQTQESSQETTQKPLERGWELKLSGVIGPAFSDLFVRTLEKAADQQVHLMVLSLDTPGGLDKSMRTMIKAIIASPVPVVTFVYPKGARAASAGTYILYASHVAAMAPATNLGAATPVQIGVPGFPRPPGADPKDQKAKPATDTASTLQRKILNDAVAYIRGLADLHGRNADWAEKAVREAASLDSGKALEEGVIDLIAVNTADLLAKLDGRVLQVQDRDYPLNTKGLILEQIIPDWRSNFLAVITNPNVAYILMLLGVYGLLLEFYNPGVGLPGVVGAISLLLALYALQLLPVSYAGLALMLLGIGLMIAEALSPSFGILGLGGAVSFAFGSVLLMDTELPAYRIALPTIAAFTLFSACVCIFALAMALKARKSRVVSGVQTLIGQQAIAIETFDNDGKVTLQGEIWNAHTEKPVQQGDSVSITAVNDLTLEVKNLKAYSKEEKP